MIILSVAVVWSVVTLFLFHYTLCLFLLSSPLSLAQKEVLAAKDAEYHRKKADNDQLEALFVSLQQREITDQQK